MAKAKRAPCVNLRTDVHKDERFAALADIAGLPGGRYEAIGRMHGLYSWCIDRKLKDAPEDSDGFVVSAAVVARFLGPSGVMALLAEHCDELALGVEIEPGRYYLRGTSEYVAAIRALERSAVAGGKARAGDAPRREGKFVADHTITPADGYLTASDQAPADQRSGTCQPAVTSVLPSSSFLDHTHARERHPDAGRVATKVWQHAAKSHAALKASGVDPTAPPWPVMQPADHPGWQALLDRVCELLVDSTPEAAEEVGMRRVDVAAAEARAKGTSRWFNSVAMFKAQSFAIGAAMHPDQMRKPADPRSRGPVPVAIPCRIPRTRPPENP